MPDDSTPYVSRNPGDVISAKDWGDVQVHVKQDLAARIAELEKRITEAGVNRAGNAEAFDGRSPDEWLAQLDERYAAKIHDHEGVTSYRRYIKRFSQDAGFDKILLPHGLRRYPLVDVYELMPVITTDKVNDAPPYAGCKLFFYYGAEDADAYGQWAVAYRDRVPLGLRFAALLDELGLEYTERSTVEDLLNDFWEALARDPNDRIPHCQSPWTTECCERHRTVGDLKRSGQWDDLYLGIRPRKIAVGAAVENAGDGQGAVIGTGTVEVTQADYDTLLVEVRAFPTDAVGNLRPLDLMFLLRS